MREGLLWFDADPKRDLRDKVIAADARYRRKFGMVPNICYINPDHLDGMEGLTVGIVRLLAAHNVLKHHFLIGVE